MNSRNRATFELASTPFLLSNSIMRFRIVISSSLQKHYPFFVSLSSSPTFFFLEFFGLGSVSVGRFDPKLGATAGFAEAVFLLGITALFAGLETISLTVKSEADNEWLSDSISNSNLESSSKPSKREIKGLELGKL
ncbi:hypothetical protein TB2_039477 [Malus domestica]